ncbi:hypothetical protein [Saccharibacillus sacchari]|uniref:Uncharacterized protein n=1 Tax=Saccharibacillus sacchari TaxID=456493 RepID=A0ACC6PAD0_9BACL
MMQANQNNGPQKIELSPQADLSAHLSGWTPISAALGHDGKAYLLSIDERPESEPGVALTKLKTCPAYKVLIVDLGFADVDSGLPGVDRPSVDRPSSGDRDDLADPATAQSAIREILIEGESFHYHYVQPLGDELLVVGANSRYYDRDRYDLNAAVFDHAGRAQRRFLLGDGVQQVQTTAEGLIWTSFFDEGVFGNRGWVRPVGESGLIAWDRNGIRVFTNSEANIADCYALNAVSDEEVWFYYYTDFKLCRLSGPAAVPNVSFLDPGLSGSSLIAKDGESFLMDNGYGNYGTYTLMRQNDSGALTAERTIEFVKPDGERIEHGMRDARGGQILLFEENKLYRFALNE